MQRNYLDDLSKSLEHAQKMHGVTGENADIYTWPQVWSDSTCGFRGVGMQAMTSALTVVFILQDTQVAHVYHAGKFAYTIAQQNQKFWDLLRAHRFPGASDKIGIAKITRDEAD